MGVASNRQMAIGCTQLQEPTREAESLYTPLSIATRRRVFLSPCTNAPRALRFVTPPTVSCCAEKIPSMVEPVRLTCPNLTSLAISCSHLAFGALLSLDCKNHQ